MCESEPHFRSGTGEDARRFIIEQSVALPVDLDRELELPRIVSRRRRAGVCKQRADSGYIKSVRNVEHVGNQIHVHTLAEWNSLGDSQIVEDGPRSNSGIAAEVAVEL